MSDRTVATAGLNEAERAHLHTHGYCVRDAVFDTTEIDQIVACCEMLVESLVRDRKGPRTKVGSYVFDPDLTKGVMIKWEGDTDVVHGIEPFAHLSPELEGGTTNNSRRQCRMCSVIPRLSFSPRS